MAPASSTLCDFFISSIKSPIDGKIGSISIHEGNYVTVQSGVLATITQINPIYAIYSVDSKDFDRLKDDEFVPDKNASPINTQIIFSNGKTYSKLGKQDFLDNEISQSTGTIDFRATFDNSEGELIPGDFVKVIVYSNSKLNAPVISQNLTLQDANGKYVWAIDENSQVYQKYFKDNGQYENYWIIKEGLNEGDKYIVTKLTSLMPKMKVKIAEPKQQEVK